MATFKKRGDGWQARVRRKLPGASKKARALTKTFPTKARAERWAAAKEAEILEGMDRHLPFHPISQPIPSHLILASYPLTHGDGLPNPKQPTHIVRCLFVIVAPQ